MASFGSYEVGHLLKVVCLGGLFDRATMSAPDRVVGRLLRSSLTYVSPATLCIIE